MRILIGWVLVGGGVVALLTLVRSYLRDDTYVTTRWLDQYERGLYDGAPRHDPDDWSRLRMLKRLADADHKHLQ